MVLENITKICVGEKPEKKLPQHGPITIKYLILLTKIFFPNVPSFFFFCNLFFFFFNFIASLSSEWKVMLSIENSLLLLDNQEISFTDL